MFTFHVSADYPHKPPAVLCKTKVYHPNIDLEGKVCLNVLREDWKPVLNINTIIYGLNHLFVVRRPLLLPVLLPCGCARACAEPRGHAPVLWAYRRAAARQPVRVACSAGLRVVSPRGRCRAPAAPAAFSAHAELGHLAM